MSIDNEDDFQAEKNRLLSEAEAANKRAEEAQAKMAELKLETQFESAYRESGGSAHAEDYELIKQFLGDRMQVQNSQPVFVDKYGMVEHGADGPKTLAEKLTELKATSAFKHCFSEDSTGSQANEQTGQKIYSREDARSGKANIEDIAFGRASVENTSGKPDFVSHTKKVNIDDILKGK